MQKLTISLHRARALVFDLAEVARTNPAARAPLAQARVAFAAAEAAVEQWRAAHAEKCAWLQVLAAAVQAGDEALRQQAEAALATADQAMTAAQAREAWIRQVLAAATAAPLSQTQGESPASLASQAAQVAPAQPAAQPQSGGTRTVTATVLECRQTASGAVRAWCQLPDGSRVAVYARNGVAQRLAAVQEGGQVTLVVKDGDHGLIAFK